MTTTTITINSPILSGPIIVTYQHQTGHNVQATYPGGRRCNYYARDIAEAVSFAIKSIL